MKTCMIGACAAMILFAAVSSAAPADVDPAMEADILELLKLTGATANTHAIMVKMGSDMRENLRKTLPPSPRRDEILDAFFKKFNAKANPDELTRLLVPLYAKYLTRDDVKSLVQFYQSPAGQHFIHVMPQMMQEGYMVGSQWGQKIARETIVELQQEYPELRAPAPSGKDSR